MTSRRLRKIRMKGTVKGIMALRKGHHEDCVDDSPHFVPPSFGEIGFFTCNIPSDLTNHTRCRPPYDHESENHTPEEWFPQ